MNTKRKDNLFLYTAKIIIVPIIFFAVFFVFYKVKAVTTPDISSEKCNSIEECNDKAMMARQIIEIKEKTGELLNNQLLIADSNIDQVQNQIGVSKQQIDDYNSQITRIEAQIKEKENTIKAQKEALAKIIQTYYEVNLASPVISYLTDGNIISFIIKKDRLAQTGDKIKELVDSVNAIKSNLEKQSVEINNKKSEIVATNEKLQSQNIALESAKKQKANLLIQTKGEESRYRDILVSIEKQKQELLDIDALVGVNFSLEGLSVSEYLKKHEPPSSLYASTDWYFSQKDPKWADETIGNTKTLMKSYGCAVTAVAMVFKEHGGSINPGDLASEPIFSGDLINWPNTWTSPKLALTNSGKSHGNISWSIIDAQLAKKNPVIVYIGKTKGSGGHYVVIHHKESSTGKYVVHDPYFGPNIYLDTTRALVGAMGTASGTSMNQMIIYN